MVFMTKLIKKRMMMQKKKNRLGKLNGVHDRHNGRSVR